ncbi:conserved hypothetical protein [Sulfolobus islandicus Y.G.57.14]|jgi:hypothetical protein|uniref:C2-H2 zinc finger protein n=12 Tax=Saccharolobus TaxID=2100760 RepID=A0A8F5BN72_SACSH|nr:MULTISPECIES: hypothetical protein [Sulfolobaceae]ACP34352.1 conserved hypothetical protein [Sulfolobus islandicus L.S.2.15]ACP37057.1 conserved hypothetical protein [Sulfolobus islandicus M.14.25]ACP44463.1 conserved hypothetical protein [Sulfolobus islandicus Y.G.57.14]ACP49676.1 conserved hypothetical protein [Sulfolobus islandicus Y.N.15.51]ACP54196.1 conserved hypothetical protein [Sulfolobus islandicus M.16.27]
MDSGITIIAEKLIDPSVKKACKMVVKDDEIIKLVGISSKKLALNVIDKVSFWLVYENNNLLYCKLCNRGPFTKKGLYLHLSRVHRREIREMLEEELRHEIRTII